MVQCSKAFCTFVEVCGFAICKWSVVTILTSLSHYFVNKKYLRTSTNIVSVVSRMKLSSLGFHICIRLVSSPLSSFHTVVDNSCS